MHFSDQLLNMPHLTQLYIMRKWVASERWANKAKSLWPDIDIDKPKEIAIQYAKTMKTKCPSLQYIRMEDWAWQFIPKYRPTQTPGDDNIESELLELDWDEILSLELFAMDTVEWINIRTIKISAIFI